MMGVSEMKLVDYKVLKASFELNQNYEFKQNPISIKPEFSRNVKKINDSQYDIILSINISSQGNKHPIPFFVEAVISSTFELQNWESEEIKPIAINNATAIMFPYLRSLLSSITLNGNIPPYVLPIINVSKLFN